MAAREVIILIVIGIRWKMRDGLLVTINVEWPNICGTKVRYFRSRSSTEISER